MQYEPKHNESDQNYDKEGGFAHFSKLAIYLVAFVIIVSVVLNFGMGVLIKFIPEGKEYKLFSKSFSTNDYSQQEKEIDKITQKLLRCANLKHSVKIELSDEIQPNAAATLTSKIIVNQGIFKAVKSENGLAFILAHEIAHFKHRDHLKGTGANIILSIIFGNNTFGDVAQNASQSKYSRKQEEDADKFGLKILNCAYGHVGGATEFFEIMLEHDDRTFFKNIFGSHPLLKDRIRKMNSYGYAKKETQPLHRVFKQYM